VSRQSKGEECMNSGWFHNRTEWLAVDNSWALGEATEDPICLVAIEVAFGIKIVAENPLADDDVDSGRARHEIQVLLDCRAANSSSIAACQLRSARAAQCGWD
jgi:hypothetical protein